MWALRHRAGVSIAALGALLAVATGLAWIQPAMASDRARLALEITPAPITERRRISDYQRLPEGRVFPEGKWFDRPLESESILFLRLSTPTPSYLYLFTRGASGSVFVNFPTPAHVRDGDPALANPLPPGSSRIPIGRVGGAAGFESFFALVRSRESAEVKHLVDLALGADGSDQERRMNELLNELGREALRDVHFDDRHTDDEASARLRRDTEWLWTWDLERLRDHFNAETCFRWVIPSR
jgi:hypothetical protein